MPFKLGNLSGDKIYLGNTEVTSAFLGTQQVYSSGLPPFELGTVTYDNVSFTLPSPPQSSMGAINFNNDGTRFYNNLTGSWGGRMYQYDLSTPYDLSTAINNNVTFEIVVTSFVFNDTGSKMYTIESSTTIKEYNLSTPFNIGTASYSNNSYNFSSTSSRGGRLKFNNDGTKLFLLQSGYGVTTGVYQFSLSTPYAITSLTYDGLFFAAIETSFVSDLRFNNTGSKMYIASSQTFHQYTLPTPFNLTNASYDNISHTFNPSVSTIEFSPDGTKIIGATLSYSTGAFAYQYTNTF